VRLFLCGLICLTIAAAAQQAPPPKPAPAASQFFSGTVTALSAESITVNRKGFGKDSVTRTFVIDRATKVEGRLRVKAKVTVRYAASGDGERAVHIIVR